MSTVLQILGWWTLLSCTIGPLFTWSFFWFEREERDGRRIEARRDAAYSNGWAASGGDARHRGTTAIPGSPVYGER